MLKIASLHSRGIHDEVANRMMLRHGSDKLLRALRGEAPKPVKCQPRREPRRHIRKADLPNVTLPTAVRRILNEVAEAFDVTVDDIRGPDRARYLISARAVCIRLMRDRAKGPGEGPYTVARIGSYMDRDHSTVCHALQMFPIYCKHRPQVAEVYESLREPLA